MISTISISCAIAATKATPQPSYILTLLQVDVQLRPRFRQMNYPHHEQPDASADFVSRPDTDSIYTINNSLKEIIGASCRSVMDMLCQEYINTRDYSHIWSVLCKVEGLESRVRTLKWWHWSDDSTNPTKGTFDCICSTSRILEDLLMNAMEGADVTQMYLRGILLFQNYPLDTMY